jgi:hypothetical protein
VNLLHLLSDFVWRLHQLCLCLCLLWRRQRVHQQLQQVMPVVQHALQVCGCGGRIPQHAADALPLPDALPCCLRLISSTCITRQGHQ